MRSTSLKCFQPSLVCSVKGSPFPGVHVSLFKCAPIRDTTTQTCSSVRPWTSSRSNSHFLPASTMAQSFSSFSVGSLDSLFFFLDSLFCFLQFLFFFFLSTHADKSGVRLELKPEEHSRSIPGFPFICGMECVSVCLESRFAVASPT
jgi:hypothetical protein